MNQYRCETCKFKDATNEELRMFHLRRCTKCNFIIEPISHDQMEIHGCASHSDFQAEREKILRELDEFENWIRKGYSRRGVFEEEMIAKILAIEAELREGGE